jgi:Bacterial Ig-like domain (group 3)
VRITRRLAVGLGAALLAASMPLLAAAPASGTTTPPWEPDTHALGNLTFYDASGQVVTGGSDLGHLFAYAQGSTADTTGGLKATLQFSNPQPAPTPLDTGNFPTAADKGSVATVQPASGVPAPIDNTKPVVNTDTSTGADLADFLAVETGSSAAGYLNVWQIRVVTSGGPNGGSNANEQWWESDVMVNPIAGTWIEIYPTQGTGATTTTTTLQAAPAGSTKQHQSVMLTANVTAADSTHPAGSVEFFQDGQTLGTADVDTGTGDAALTTSALLPSAPGKTKLTATFSPTDTSGYGPSTSAAVHYTVDPVAQKPSITGPHQVGGTEKCSANGLTFGVSATYSWLVSGKKVATGKTLVVPSSAYKKKLACTATVRAGSGPTSSATSKTVVVSLGKPLKATKKPTLSGPHKVGKKETVKPGTWSPRASSYSYQWLANGKAIKGATKSSLKLSKSVKGKKVSCKVTAHASGHANGTATTKSVKVSG